MIESGICAILNLVSGKYYVGSAANLYQRWHGHKSLLKHNKHDNSYLQRSWNKHGQQNFMFVVIERVEKDCLVQREQYWIDETKCHNKSIGYNLRLLATSNLGIRFSDEGKQNISKAKIGTIASAEARINMSLASTTRNEEKWPHTAKCHCDLCNITHRERNKRHAREWRMANPRKIQKIYERILS